MDPIQPNSGLDHSSTHSLTRQPPYPTSLSSSSSYSSSSTLLPSLTYFPARGSCDKVRLYLSELDIHYEEKNVSGKAAALARKVSPFGDLPLYTDTSNSVSGGLPIMLYLAEKHDERLSLTEKTFLTNLAWSCEMVLSTLWSQEFGSSDSLSDFAISQNKTQFLQSYIVPTLTLIVKDLHFENGPYVLGTRFTFGDICLFSMLEAVDKELPIALAAFPTLALFRERVASRPKIRQLTESGKRF